MSDWGWRKELVSWSIVECVCSFDERPRNTTNRSDTRKSSPSVQQIFRSRSITSREKVACLMMAWRHAMTPRCDWFQCPCDNSISRGWFSFISIVHRYTTELLAGDRVRPTRWKVEPHPLCRLRYAPFLHTLISLLLATLNLWHTHFNVCWWYCACSVSIYPIDYFFLHPLIFRVCVCNQFHRSARSDLFTYAQLWCRLNLYWRLFHAVSIG